MYVYIYIYIYIYIHIYKYMWPLAQCFQQCSYFFRQCSKKCQELLSHSIFKLYGGPLPTSELTLPTRKQLSLQAVVQSKIKSPIISMFTLPNRTWLTLILRLGSCLEVARTKKSYDGMKIQKFYEHLRGSSLSENLIVCLTSNSL